MSSFGRTVSRAQRRCAHGSGGVGSVAIVFVQPVIQVRLQLRGLGAAVIDVFRGRIELIHVVQKTPMPNSASSTPSAICWLPERRGGLCASSSKSNARELSRCRAPAITVTTTTKNVRGFCAAFAISAAIITVALGVTAATRMGAFFWVFHALHTALLAPLLSDAGLAYLIAGTTGQHILRASSRSRSPSFPNAIPDDSSSRDHISLPV